MINAVWAKSTYANETDNANWFRKDQCGAWIQYKEHWNRNSKYWWEIDHITPEANWGTDILSNLRPLHWKNNLKKSDWRLSCPVKSSGNQNIWL
jgi:hypothetical protein